jgi:rare lipoprotein A (peptidoglycan hydrolase)
MKKFCAAILILTFFSACTDKKIQSVKKRSAKTRISKKYSKSGCKKFSYHIKPSESMQAGLSQNKCQYNLTRPPNNKPENAGLQNIKSSANLLVTDSKTAINDEKYNKYNGHFKIGNPYQIAGISYIPQDYEDYKEIGVASWYGDGFHGKYTANGEIYDMDDVTAAHPTLPLPSLVLITNLRNGRKIIARVNDRGPFAKNRVIDVSQKAADLLGFKTEGTTEVKVELLRSDTNKMLEKLRIKN